MRFFDFPRTRSLLNVARQKGVQATHAALNSNRRILLLYQQVELEEGEEVTPEHLHAIGAVANIIESYEPGDGTIRIAIASEQRAIVLRFKETDDFLSADVQIAHEEIGLASTSESLMKEARKLFNEYAKTRQQEQGRGSQSQQGLTSDEVKTLYQGARRTWTSRRYYRWHSHAHSIGTPSCHGRT